MQAACPDVDPHDPIPQRVHRRAKRLLGRATVVAVACGVASLAIPATASHADPEPSLNELKNRSERLHTQVGQLTEQYNGLRVRLSQAKRAAKVSKENSERQTRALRKIQGEVGEMAANSYKNGRVSPGVSFVSTEDPDGFLSKAATVNYFARQDGDRVLALSRARQATERARRSAESRASRVSTLTASVKKKKNKIEKTLGGVRGDLLDIAVDRASSGKSIPDLGNLGPGKAAGALRAALSKLGKPYVWGAAGPNQFDCSGLTLWAYKQVGINLPHYTGDQFNAGQKISRGKMQPGDLVFFYNDLHHMGMYVGDGKMVHAPRTGDVIKIEGIGNRPFAGAVRLS